MAGTNKITTNVRSLKLDYLGGDFPGRGKTWQQMQNRAPALTSWDGLKVSPMPFPISPLDSNLCCDGQTRCTVLTSGSHHRKGASLCRVLCRMSSLLFFVSPFVGPKPRISAELGRTPLPDLQHLASWISSDFPVPCVGCGTPPPASPRSRIRVIVGGR